MSSAPAIIFAGGGSGGHISPGLAIAERIASQRPDADRVFVCSERPIDREMLQEAGEDFVTIPATPPIMRPASLWRFLRTHLRSRSMVRELIQQRHITHVIALGGFVAAPAAVAGHQLGIPVTLVNLDSPPGKANRWMRAKCEHVFSAVDVPEPRGFADEVVGLPLRQRALAPGDAAACRKELQLDPDRPTLLVTGASQGATSINEMLIELLRHRSELFHGWQVLHLAGRDGDEPVRAAYQEAGVPGRVEPFLHEIGLAWGAADVAVSRAGANSVAEIAANRVPAIFIPYPHHADRHQERNAAPLAKVGGAMIVEDRITPKASAALLQPALRKLMNDPAKRATMRERLESLPFSDAAARIAAFALAGHGHSTN